MIFRFTFRPKISFLAVGAKSSPDPWRRTHQVLIRVSLSRAVADTLGLESMFPPHVEVTVPVWLNNVGMPLGGSG